jgi:DNA repair protein RecN (Recombination protein N)
VANKVGQRLKELSKKVQIIIVTHHAQIASKADTQILIERNRLGKATISKIDGEKRKKHIAQMLSGVISESSVKHADELIKISE